MSSDEEQRDTEMEQTLRDIYYSPAQGYRSTENIYQQAKKTLPDLKRSQVINFLKAQKPYTVYKHRTMIKTFRQTWVKDFGQMQVDLVDFSNSKSIKREDNDGYIYIISCIEILSRYAFTAKTKRKTPQVILNELKEILEQYRERFGKEPTVIQFDEGGEFQREVKTYLKEKGIQIWLSGTERKAPIVERFNRTLQEKIRKRFLYNGNTEWYTALEDLTTNYNSQVNRSIGMAPKDVNEENKHQVWMKLFGSVKGPIPKPKYKINDQVRVFDYVMHGPDIRKWKKLHPKDYKADVESRREAAGRVRSQKEIRDRAGVKNRARFSNEVFTIHSIKLGYPTTYKLYSDRIDDVIIGIFYEWELSHVK